MLPPSNLTRCVVLDKKDSSFPVPSVLYPGDESVPVDDLDPEDNRTNGGVHVREQELQCNTETTRVE